MSAKAATAAEARKLEEIPNIGPAVARTLRERPGWIAPRELARRDPYVLFEQIETQRGPCDRVPTRRTNRRHAFHERHSAHPLVEIHRRKKNATTAGLGEE